MNAVKPDPLTPNQIPVYQYAYYSSPSYIPLKGNPQLSAFQRHQNLIDSVQTDTIQQDKQMSPDCEMSRQQSKNTHQSKEQTTQDNPRVRIQIDKSNLSIKLTENQEKQMSYQNKKQEDFEIEFKHVESKNEPENRCLKRQIKPLKTKQQSSQIKSYKKQGYQCKLCGKVFDLPSQLGGHASRTHKGKNEEFKRKLNVRNQRKFDRQFHYYAKEEYLKLYGTQDFNRTTLKNLKERLKPAFKKFYQKKLNQ